MKPRQCGPIGTEDEVGLSPARMPTNSWTNQATPASGTTPGSLKTDCETRLDGEQPWSETDYGRRIGSGFRKHRDSSGRSRPRLNKNPAR